MLNYFSVCVLVYIYPLHGGINCGITENFDSAS